MSTDFRARSDTEEAMRWLQRQLHWEQILTELREAGDRKPARKHEEPAAA